MLDPISLLALCDALVSIVVFGLLATGRIRLGRIAIATTTNLVLILALLRGHALTHGVDLWTIALGFLAIYCARYTVMFWPYLLPDRIAHRLG